MLSYQHAYHAGNLADVHKHGLLAWMLEYLTRKDKPLSYLETHAGRALYDLSGDAAVKTGEAARGIEACLTALPSDHPYARVVAHTRTARGARAYPGSPFIAHSLLRNTDNMHLAELHPQEHTALRQVLPRAQVHHRDGLEMAFATVPPTPRRGLLLIDPSYEVKAEYKALPGQIRKLHRAWNIGVICLWYPVLASNAQAQMCKILRRDHAEAFCHEIRFPPARPGHGMIGSGLLILNPPFGLAQAARDLETYLRKAGALTVR